MTNIIRINNLTHTYNNSLKVLDNISFDVSENEFITLIGPSGCGKSTLFKILTKLIPNYEGNVSINNQDLHQFTNALGYMPQKDLLLPWRTLFDNVVLPLEIQKQPINNDEINELITTFGLDGFQDHYPHQLSGGMRQRAALLRTFLMSQDIVLLDEPFAALDYLTKRHLQAWLKDIFKKLNKTVIFITHDIEEAINLSDRLIVLSSLPASVLEVIDVKNIDSSKDNKKDILVYQNIKSNIISLIG